MIFVKRCAYSFCKNPVAISLLTLLAQKYTYFKNLPSYAGSLQMIISGFKSKDISVSPSAVVVGFTIKYKSRSSIIK